MRETTTLFFVAHRTIIRDSHRHFALPITHAGVGRASAVVNLLVGAVDSNAARFGS